ncbi:TlpA family protein disulfide reductase [Flexivirga caeni]|uniref:Methylamine utilisation protein MauE domain-containing protein n=1 Tax=Flexivirga caeni TaxID=2294115 RepID=A0A3M9MF82_9MICO|nr:MauE/DoxX family redox-associated membrane protein [Flexivirga caeni]RNI24212.1 hypothetical protein EFY87_04350 [Flexivirga caeni]
MTDWIGALFSWVVGAVLVASGVLKLGTAIQFQSTLTQFRLPTWTWAGTGFARLFPWIEMLLGLGVVAAPDPWGRAFAYGALALLLALLVLVVRIFRVPGTVTCNCFGGLGDDTVGRSTIVRNVALVVIGVLAVATERCPASVAADRTGGWAYPLPAACAIAGAGLLVLWRAVRQRRRTARLIRTLTVRDVGGNELPITEFQDPPTFLVFFSSGCGGCQSLVEQFRWWPNLLREGYDLQPVLLGTPEQFGREEVFAPLVPYAWYAGSEVASAMQLTGLPGAVLIDAEHPLGGEKAAGHFAVRDLVLCDGWTLLAQAAVSADEDKSSPADNDREFS